MKNSFLSLKKNSQMVVWRSDVLRLTKERRRVRGSERGERWKCFQSRDGIMVALYRIICARIFTFFDVREERGDKKIWSVQKILHNPIVLCFNNAAATTTTTTNIRSTRKSSLILPPHPFCVHTTHPLIGSEHFIFKNSVILTVERRLN